MSGDIRRTTPKPNRRVRSADSQTESIKYKALSPDPPIQGLISRLRRDSRNSVKHMTRVKGRKLQDFVTTCLLTSLCLFTLSSCDSGSPESSEGKIVAYSSKAFENPSFVTGEPGAIVPVTVQLVGPILRGVPGRNGRRDPVKFANVQFRFKKDYHDFLPGRKSKRENDGREEGEKKLVESPDLVSKDASPAILDLTLDPAPKDPDWRPGRDSKAWITDKLSLSAKGKIITEEEAKVTIQTDVKGLATAWIRLGKFVGAYRVEAQFNNELNVDKNVNVWLFSGVKVVPKDPREREGPSGSRVRVGVQIFKVDKSGKSTIDNSCDVWFHSNSANAPFWRREETQDAGAANVEIRLGRSTEAQQIVAELDPDDVTAPIRGLVIDYYSINWTEIALMAISAIVAFITGLRLVAQGLVRAFHSILHLPTSTFAQGRWLAMLGGTAEGALFLSSSAVISRLVHFANGGLLVAAGAAGQILGAQFGKTILLQVLAFDLISNLAVPLVVLGTVLWVFSARLGTRYWGSLLLGAGLVVLSWVAFVHLAELARSSPSFAGTIQQWDPMVSHAAGGSTLLNFAATFFYTVLATILLRSSMLFLLPTMALSAAGVISADMFVAVLLGSCVGSSLGIFLASLPCSVEARRTALINVVFQFFGALWLFVFTWIPVEHEGNSVSLFLFLIDSIAPGKLFHLEPENVSHHLATLHTVFHLANGLILIVLGPWTLKLVDRYMPRDPVKDDVKPYRLDPHLREVPSLGLAQATREAVYLVELVRKTLAESFDTFRYLDLNLAEQISRRDESVTTIQREISHYLMDLARSNLSQKEVSRLHILQEAVGNLVRVIKEGEQLRNQTVIALEEKIEIPEEILKDLTELYDLLMSQFENVLQILENPDRRVEETAVKLAERLARSGARIESGWLQKTRPVETPSTAFLICREAYRSLTNATGHLSHVAERMRVLALR